MRARIKASETETPSESPPDTGKPEIEEKSLPERGGGRRDTKAESQGEKLKFSVASLDEGFAYFENNHPYTFGSPEEETEVRQACAEFMAGTPSDKYDFEILDVEDNKPVFPDHTSTATGRTTFTPPEGDINKWGGAPQHTVNLELPTGEEERLAAQDRARQGQRMQQGTEMPKNAEGSDAPYWQNNYFSRVKDKTRIVSWQNFNPLHYANITPKSINEIQSNPRYAQDFGEMVMANDPSKSYIFDKIRQKQPLSPVEEQFTTFIQYEFTKNVLEVERLTKDLGKQLEELVAVNPFLRQEVDRYGHGAVTKYYQDLIHRAGMTDKGVFDQMTLGFARWMNTAASERAKAAQTRALDICKQMNMPRRNYELMFGIGDPNYRRESVQQGVKERLLSEAMRTKGAINWVDKLSAWRKSHVLTWQARRSMPDHWKLLSPRSWKTSAQLGAKQDIAGGLAFLSYANPEIRPEMTYAAFTGEKLPEQKFERGPKSWKEMQSIAAKNAYNDANIDTTLLTKITQRNGSKENFLRLPQQQQNKQLQEIESEIMGEEAEGFGMFSLFLRWLFSSRFSESTQRVIGRPMYAHP